ncbi:MAG: folate-binding protein [Pseudomonadota bacterium]
MTVAHLADRTVIDVSGPARLDFLDGLFTVSVADMAPGTLRYGALLTPQGKIVTDLFVHAEADRLRLDVPEAAAADLTRRLTMYKLRAAVELAASDDPVVVGIGAPDPRADGLPARQIGGAADGARTFYDSARVAAGVPDAALDFALGDTFPHDANMDHFGGVDFQKGCFVGQEVVSRMRHRGTARRRTVRVTAEAPLPDGEVMAGEKAIGKVGTRVGEAGLAIVRLDRAVGPLTVGGVPVHLSVPDGAAFSLPA